MESEKYNALVEAIYDAAINPERWDVTVPGLKEAFDAIAAGFFVQTADQNMSGASFQGLDHNELGNFPNSNSTTSVIKTTPQNSRRKQDIHYDLRDSLLNMHDTILSIISLRSQETGRTCDTEIKCYQSLCRHLMKAVQINALTACTAPVPYNQEQTFSSLRIAVITLDVMGNISFMNKYAVALLEDKNGLCEAESRLMTVDQNNQKLLDSAIDRASREHKSITLALTRTTAKELSLCVTPPCDKRNIFGEANRSVTIFISDPDDRAISNIDGIASRWQLSPLEARFALQLIQGNTIKEIAATLSLTHSTAQWYCKQIMQKLGCKRQTELVLKLTNDVAIFLDLASH